MRADYSQVIAHVHPTDIFNRRSIRNRESLMKSLTDWIRWSAKTLKSDDNEKTAFITVKNGIFRSIVLAQHIANPPISIAADECDSAVGGMQQQWSNKFCQLLTLLSRRLQNT